MYEVSKDSNERGRAVRCNRRRSASKFAHSLLCWQSTHSAFPLLALYEAPLTRLVVQEATIAAYST